MSDRRAVGESVRLLLILVLGTAAPTTAQVHRVAALNTEQIRVLDRARTVVILPGGILEQHGPYLPTYTDGYCNERLAQAVAEAVAARPGWAALVFPSIPLGTGGANEIGRKYVFPGTSSWPGYFGSPRLATAAQGARLNRAATDAAVTYALKILDGMDPRDSLRLGDVARDSPENVAIDADALRREIEILRKQEEWLTRKKSR